MKNFEFYIDMKLLPKRRHDDSSIYFYVQAVQVIMLRKGLNLYTQRYRGTTHSNARTSSNIGLDGRKL